MPNSSAEKEIRRLFLGVKVEAPWPERLPAGRLVEEEGRHVTLAFLGSCSLNEILEKIQLLPSPSGRLGFAGIADRMLFLPERFPRVAALHLEWSDREDFASLHSMLKNWLDEQGYILDKRPHLSHCTLARAPFNEKEWKESFYPLPAKASEIHLYESSGNLHYRSLWSAQLIPAIEEIEHTADIAFTIRGRELAQLFLHAQIALAFHYPPFIDYFRGSEEIEDIDQAISQLNAIIADVDSEIGCPLKAVSFHGEARKATDGYLHWEMIVDV